VTPCYYVIDCVEAADGELYVLDMRGGVGGGLRGLAAGYGGQGAARARLRPYLERLGALAGGKRVLFLHDAFTAPFPYPDDFFNLVQQFAEYAPVTDWVPDLQSELNSEASGPAPAPEAGEMGAFLDPLAARLRLKLGYCTGARVDELGTEGMPRPMVLLSGYRERARQQGASVIVEPGTIGAVVFTGASSRFPDDLKRQDWFPVVNPPLLDRLFECRWLPGMLLRGAPVARMLVPSIPVGMGMRTASEVLEWVRGLHAPGGFPLAVLKPALVNLSSRARYLDRVALRALAARQSARRLPPRLGEELLEPRVSHTYEELSSYRGKVLDNLLRTPGAEVHDHGDGTFHFSAPYPFLEATVGHLQQYVESAPVRSRRTGRYHRALLRVVMFDRKVVSALYHMDQEADDGTFRDLTVPGANTFPEAAEPAVAARLQEALGELITELEARFAERVQGPGDLAQLRAEWLAAQTRGSSPAPGSPHEAMRSEEGRGSNG
jgi:hypothetical protein